MLFRLNPPKTRNTTTGIERKITIQSPPSHLPQLCPYKKAMEGDHGKRNKIENVGPPTPPPPFFPQETPTPPPPKKIRVGDPEIIMFP